MEAQPGSSWSLRRWDSGMALAHGEQEAVRPYKGGTALHVGTFVSLLKHVVAVCP